MLSYEITKWFNVIILHSITWITWCLQLYIHFLFNILLLIFFYIILLFVSHSLPKKCDYFLSLSLSLLLILSCNSILDWWFIYLFIFLCLYFWMIHFGVVFLRLFITWTLYPSYNFGFIKFLDILEVRWLCIWMSL